MENSTASILNTKSSDAPLIIGLASDHAGFELKEFVKTILTEKGISYNDFGACNTDSSDYADFGHPLASAIGKREISVGIAMCGSGNGMNITLNKHLGIRSALCWNEEIARLARAHNDANILVLPGRFITKIEAEKCVEIFLSTPFEGGRHQCRIDKIPLE